MKTQDTQDSKKSGGGTAAAVLEYQSGFGNEFASEALPGALPIARNSPQRAPYGLYAELLSGTAFTVPRAANRRSWVYRIRPSATHASFRPIDNGKLCTAPIAAPPTPDQLRWSPLPIAADPADFVEGLHTLVANGNPELQLGMAAHIYLANRSMSQRYFVNVDGEFLIVPQQGRLRLVTEMGVIEVEPKEIAVIPRGIRYRVELPDGPSSGYVCENYGAAFRLPELGPLGSNGLANARDFLTPVAAYEDRDAECELVTKFAGQLYAAKMDHSPLDVVAWHGNLAPYKYDTTRFMTIGTVSYDHPDPSIYTVLTSPSDSPGTANIDFVIFPPRWLVGEDTFRPPWYHRNVMSEFMGLVLGQYDAKPEGFLPGGASLHNSQSAHGPDVDAFENASKAELRPHKLDNTLAFMFESRYLMRPTPFAMHSPQRQADYQSCWTGLKKHFDGKPK